MLYWPFFWIWFYNITNNIWFICKKSALDFTIFKLTKSIINNFWSIYLNCLVDKTNIKEFVLICSKFVFGIIIKKNKIDIIYDFFDIKLNIMAIKAYLSS